MKEVVPSLCIHATNPVYLEHVERFLNVHVLLLHEFPVAMQCPFPDFLVATNPKISNVDDLWVRLLHVHPRLRLVRAAVFNLSATGAATECAAHEPVQR